MPSAPETTRRPMRGPSPDVPPFTAEGEYWVFSASSATNFRLVWAVCTEGTWHTMNVIVEEEQPLGDDWEQSARDASEIGRMTAYFIARDFARTCFPRLDQDGWMPLYCGPERQLPGCSADDVVSYWRHAAEAHLCIQRYQFAADGRPLWQLQAVTLRGAATIETGTDVPKLKAIGEEYLADRRRLMLTDASRPELSR